MKVGQIRLLQQCLEVDGCEPGGVDGVLGVHTYIATGLALVKRAATLPADWREWSNNRLTVACLQLFCREKKIEVGEVDGLWGPQTEYAVDALAYFMEHNGPPPLWRDQRPNSANPHGWPDRAEADLIAFYGAPGSNQTTIVLPYPLRISWDRGKIVHSFSCHQLVRNSLATVLNHVLEHYGSEQIRNLGLDLWGGCLNVRPERGGSQWSTHSWGIAIDFDPDRNQLKWCRDRAAFARPEYDAWWQCWEEEGWTSLGRSKNYDWMHVQAARF